MRLSMMLVPYIALAILATCAPLPDALAAKVFRQECADCQGRDGRGNGPRAAELPVAPADLTRIAANNGGTFPTEDVMIAVHGYRGQEMHGLMPAYGDMLQSRDVIWVAPDGRRIETPRALLAMAYYIESLQE